MSGEEIRFRCNGQEYVFKENEKAQLEGKKFLGKNKFKNIKPLFEAIVNYDKNKDIPEKELKKISAKEMDLLKKLKEIIEKTGANTDYVLDNTDLALGTEFSKCSMDVEEFLNAKLAELNKKEVKNDPKAEDENSEVLDDNIKNFIDDITQNGLPHLRKKKVEQEEKPVVEEKKVKEEKVDEKPVVEEKKKPTITQQDKNNQFNKSIQNAAKKYQKEELDKTFTSQVEYKKGKYLSHIAKEALQAEGIENPTQRQVWDRLAQIAVINDIKDINNVPASKFPLKVGSGKTMPTPEQPVAGQPTPEQPVTGKKPVPALTDGLNVEKDSDLKDYTKVEATVEGVDLKGGTLETYTKVEGENTDIKFTYTKDGITFEAKDEEELVKKINDLNEGLTELATVPDGETADAKQARIQGALDKIMSLGNESAVKFAQQKLAENKANVTVDYYAEKTIAMLKSGNVALIEEMLGSDGAKFAELVNNNPEVQKAVGEVVKYLKDKFDNDEYLTLDEQKIKAILDKCVDKDGVSIEAKAAVAEVKDEQGNVTTQAQAEVFAKTMVTDNEGNSYYKATLGGEGAFKDVEFRTKDDNVLDAFLAELKVADTDEKKTALFKKYAEMENADTELIKSMVEKASTFKADAETVIALVNKSNLDVIYAMDTSHFVDTEQNAETGATGAKDKTNVQNAIKARIEAIMADPALAKLPENAKYLDKIKGIEIPAESTEFTEVTDTAGYEETTEEVPTGEKDADGNDIKITVTKYSKEGQPDVYKVEFIDPIDGEIRKISADSKENVLELKKNLETLALTRPADNETLTTEEKQDNIEKLIKIAELRPTGNTFEAIAKALKDTDLIDKNDPDAKALVQKLLLTRDAGIVRALTQKLKANSTTEYEADNTLFENDPVALKTLAAMFKEIRDLENQGVKLTPEQIALKDVLDDCVVKMKTSIDNGNTLQFDGDGNLAVHNKDWNGNNDGAVAKNSALAENYKYNKVVNDPILSKDKQALATLITTYGFPSLSKDDVINLINLDTVDAEILSYINFNNLDSDMSTEDKKAVQDAYVAKAKALFQYDTPAEGAKLDPANARYLKTILDKINSISTAGSEEGAVDPDKAVIDEILGQFFVTTGEGDSAVTTIKNFRRFTAEEMAGLADAVANHGTDAQKAALANMITVEEMEDGQFANVIVERNGLKEVTVERLANLITEDTTKEEALAMIEKLEFKNRIPYDKLIEKFGDDPEFMNTLVKNYAAESIMSEANRIKLAELYVKKDSNGNYTIDRSKLPDGVTPEKLLSILDDVRNSSTADNKNAAVKISDTILNSLTKDDIDAIKRLSTWYDRGKIQNTIARIVETYPEAVIDIINKLEEGYTATHAPYISIDLFPYSQIVSKMPLSKFGDKANSFAAKVFSYYSREGANDTNLGYLVKNGYIKKYTGISDYPMYSVPGQDDVLYRAWNKQNTTTFQPIKLDAWNKGRQLHGIVQGATSNKNTLAKINEVTKDNVVGIITGFNSLSGSRIMEQLHDEWGLEAKDMNKIPLALLEYCKNKICETNNGWQFIDDTPAYKQLSELVEKYKDHTGDYDQNKSGVTDSDGDSIPDARAIDNLIQELLSLLERRRVAGEGISSRE